LVSTQRALLTEKASSVNARIHRGFRSYLSLIPSFIYQNVETR